MKTLVQCIKALGVAIGTLAITVIASYPMVAFYAYIINPGHDRKFYEDAAQWIAPWSSYLLGPIVFFGFNYWLSKRTSKRNAMAFAIMSISFYIIIEIALLSAMSIDIQEKLFNLSGIAWLSVKLVGALLGAYLGQRSVKTAN
ncbi:hypothetical protein [Ekhidna sp.]|uniref:hypothetical protein n=1 Tax=Ekhidna sp. TaxID=2608089 RepID=UPI003298B77D